MTITVAALDDGSLAMRGAVEVLRQHRGFHFVGMFDPAAKPALESEVDSAVLLLDPFADANAEAGVGAAASEVDSTAGALKPFSLLLLTACRDIVALREALRAGARGCVRKDADVTTLVDAVNAVGFGGLYLGDLSDSLFAKDAVGAPTPALRATKNLTPRELDVLAMIAQGMTHKQIGARLSLSKSTVDTYVHRMRHKIGAANKAGLTRVAVNLGLVDRQQTADAAAG